MNFGYSTHCIRIDGRWWLAMAKERRAYMVDNNSQLFIDPYNRAETGLLPPAGYGGNSTPPGWSVI